MGNPQEIGKNEKDIKIKREIPRLKDQSVLSNLRTMKLLEREKIVREYGKSSKKQHKKSMCT